MFRRLVVIVALASAVLAHAQSRISDLIYMKSAGAAFTMDVFKPKTANGAVIMYLVSGGWFSSHEGINPLFAAPLNAAGYTVVEVVHGSQPKYTIPEIARMITRAIRFVHFNAASWGCDPNRIGITGASAGGHLSLLCAGRGDNGDASAADAIEKSPSTVAAVVAYMPPTDFVHFGAMDVKAMRSSPVYAIFLPAFGFPANATEEQITQLAAAESPITTVTKSFPPTLLIHGDADQLVPLQQSQTMLAALKAAGVDSNLVVVKGGGHDPKTITEGLPSLLDWFNSHLGKR
jgi:acetyl esterase/lipase